MTFRTKGDLGGGKQCVSLKWNLTGRLMSFTLCTVVIVSCIKKETHLFEKELRESSSAGV